jgi:hypothetical protein
LKEEWTQQARSLAPSPGLQLGKLDEDQLCQKLKVGRGVAAEVTETLNLFNPSLRSSHDTSEHWTLHLQEEDRIKASSLGEPSF